MTFGDVRARVVLNQPGHIHCGSELPVTGCIIVEFKSKIQSIDELFGPMDIFVFLEGRAKTKIRVQSGNTTQYYRGRAPLIAVKATVHSGPVRFDSHKPQSFPFSIQFPEKVQPLMRDEFGPDTRFDISPDAPLPPSMVCSYLGGMHKRFDCFVEYRIRSMVLMPQIDVKIHSFGEEEGGHVVLYEQPRVPAEPAARAATIRQIADKFSVSNEFLLPEEERPSGFREKAKAFFSSDAFPTMVSDIAINGTANLLLARPLSLELRIRPNTQLTSVTTELPEVWLSNCVIIIKSYTVVRTEERLFGARESEDTERILTLSGTVLDTRPFSKANDYTKTLTTKPLVGIPSTFSTFNITRTYLLDIELVLVCATKEKRFKYRDIPVRVLPPAMENDPGLGSTIPGAAAAASSSSATAATAAGPANVVNEALPTYQPPPGYTAAVEEEYAAEVEQEEAASSKTSAGHSAPLP